MKPYTTVQLNVKVTDTTADQIKRLAAFNQITVAEQLRRFIEEGLAHGCRDFLIVGSFGGRLDHTIANLHSLAFLCEQGAQGSILSNDEQAWMFQNGALVLHTWTSI